MRKGIALGGLVLIGTMLFSFSAPVFAAEPEYMNMSSEEIVEKLKTEHTNAEGKPVDRSGHVIRIDIPNKDGTYTTLEGEEAQDWYDNILQEYAQEIVADNEKYSKNESDEMTAKEEAPIETKGAFSYKYRYLEDEFNEDVEVSKYEQVVTNKIRNKSSSEQTYSLNLDVTRSWCVSPSVSGSFKNAIEAELGGSWGASYSATETFNIDVDPGKTVWVSFIPIMDESIGRTQKYFISRYTHTLVVEKSIDVVTYNPQYITKNKIGPFTFKGPYGIYVYNEE